MIKQTFLGIESSCDDTCAAVVRSVSGRGEILANVVLRQADIHALFGGVVPEIAARAHAERLDGAIQEAMTTAETELSGLDGIAVTSGPGLIGGLVSGVMAARGVALGTGLPLYGINHLAGHALTPRLTHEIPFPYLMLLVSGGHCQILLVESADSFTRLGTTIDDAPGEAFDKTARLLGLSQPGGPSVEKEARQGDPTRFRFPRPLLDRPGMDMSFSGLKTALLRARDELLTEEGNLRDSDRKDLCAAFQGAVSDVLVTKTERGIQTYLELNPEHPTVAVAGGVAANTEIRSRLQELADKHGLAFVAPPLPICTDNAAMIAWAGIEQAAISCRPYTNLEPRPRWPLDTNQTFQFGGGKKGAKV